MDPRLGTTDIGYKVVILAILAQHYCKCVRHHKFIKQVTAVSIQFGSYVSL